MSSKAELLLRHRFLLADPRTRSRPRMPVRVASSLLGTVDLVTGTNLYWLISRNKASVIPGADADAQARIHRTNTAEPYPVQLGLFIPAIRRS